MKRFDFVQSILIVQLQFAKRQKNRLNAKFNKADETTREFFRTRAIRAIQKVQHLQTAIHFGYKTKGGVAVSTPRTPYFKPKTMLRFL